MKKLVLLFIPLGLYFQVHSQLPQPKKIDSIVKKIDAQKTLKTDIVCDTFPVANSELSNIECARFYSLNGRLVKVIYSLQYHYKDTARTNISTQLDVFYYKDSLLIKVISKDFDQSPPKDTQIYLDDKHRKNYFS